MQIGSALALLLAAGMVLVGLRAAARGAEALGGLFRAERDEWPHGVQEDDDLRWRWGASGTGAAGDGEPASPVDVERVRRTSRNGPQPDRSEARARS